MGFSRGQFLFAHNLSFEEHEIFDVAIIIVDLSVWLLKNIIAYLCIKCNLSVKPCKSTFIAISIFLFLNMTTQNGENYSKYISFCLSYDHRIA